MCNIYNAMYMTTHVAINTGGAKNGEPFLPKYTRSVIWAKGTSCWQMYQLAHEKEKK